MPNVFDYAEQFATELQQKYTRELTSYPLTQSNGQVRFINAKTIKLPRLTVSGFKDHNRGSLGFNAGSVENDWEPKVLTHDRDTELALDPMDIDETNLVTEIANVQNTLETEQKIPELDSYYYAKLLAEAKSYTSAETGAFVDSTALTAANILDWFDTAMSRMDDKSVPMEGRLLFITSGAYKLLKNAEQVQRSLDVKKAGAIDRRVLALDDVTIIKVPSARMMSAYDFTDGCVPTGDATQINMILVHPTCVIAREKYSYIKVYPPGSDSRTADKYVLQERFYCDLFLIERKASGCAINVTAAGG
jgi:hypothetical protein